MSDRLLNGALSFMLLLSVCNIVIAFSFDCSHLTVVILRRCAVQCAICGGHVDILKLFLEKGCDSNTRIPDTNFTLLHEATYRCSVDAVKVCKL